MPEPPAPGNQPPPRPVRDVADGYVSALAELDPILATALGLRPGEDRLPDLSPAGQDAMDDLARTTLVDLATIAGDLSGDERRCARLLRERLDAGLAISAQGEHLRAQSNICGPPHRARGGFIDMPTASEAGWEASARMMAWGGQAPVEAHDWGWDQVRDREEQMGAEAQQVLAGATAQEAMRHLDQAGEAIDGVEEIQAWLQDMMDRAITDLDGTHFDLAAPLKTVEARIAPPGSAAAPHYTAPSQDFSRPTRTWLPP